MWGGVLYAFIKNHSTTNEENNKNSENKKLKIRLHHNLKFGNVCIYDISANLVIYMTIPLQCNTIRLGMSPKTLYFIKKSIMPRCVLLLL